MKRLAIVLTATLLFSACGENSPVFTFETGKEYKVASYHEFRIDGVTVHCAVIVHRSNDGTLYNGTIAVPEKFTNTYGTIVATQIPEEGLFYACPYWVKYGR